jgi:asparagine synthase (glutamine-hydrolysing)
MCGIFAAFGPSIHEVALDARLELLRARGDRPSAETRSGPGYFLGCYRLALQDPERGRQPVSNETESAHLVHNGEIYNFKHLRAGLTRHRFRSDCDTEVIMGLYEEFGSERFGALSGMFAFCLYDERSASYLAARDPLGIKPLYYVYEGYTGNLFVASERKCLHDLAGPIRIVPPGCILSPSGIRRYASLITVPQEFSPDKLRTLMATAVASQLVADRPVGVFLSGGLDSSIVAYHAAKLRPGIPAYTVGVRSSDDLPHASVLAASLEVSHHVHYVEPEAVLAALPRVIYALESYNATLVRVGVSAYLASRAAAEQVRAVLVGEGSDELFLGYPQVKAYPESQWGTILYAGLNHLHRTELQRLDRVSMACSLEARLPFLDNDFFRYGLGLPLTDKLRRTASGLVEKWCLREAYRGLLPDTIIDRPKVPFDEGSGVASILRSAAAARLGNADYHRSIAEYPFLEGADLETVFYFTLWKPSFLRKNEIFAGDAGRYYPQDETWPWHVRPDLAPSMFVPATLGFL